MQTTISNNIIPFPKVSKTALCRLTTNLVNGFMYDHKERHYASAYASIRKAMPIKVAKPSLFVKLKTAFKNKLKRFCFVFLICLVIEIITRSDIYSNFKII